MTTQGKNVYIVTTQRRIRGKWNTEEHQCVAETEQQVIDFFERSLPSYFIERITLK